MTDGPSHETRLVRLEERVHTLMQVAEGVRLIADQTRDAHARIDRLDDRVADTHDDVVELRTYIASVERRREAATAMLRDDLLAAVRDVKEDVADLGKRVDGQSEARITARATITVGALAASTGLVTVLIGRALGVS